MLKRSCLGKMEVHGRRNPNTRKIAEIVPSGAMKHPLRREWTQGMSLRRMNLRQRPRRR